MPLPFFIYDFFPYFYHLRVILRDEGQTWTSSTVCESLALCWSLFLCFRIILAFSDQVVNCLLFWSEFLWEFRSFSRELTGESTMKPSWTGFLFEKDIFGWLLMSWGGCFTSLMRIEGDLLVLNGLFWRVQQCLMVLKGNFVVVIQAWWVFYLFGHFDGDFISIKNFSSVFHSSILFLKNVCFRIVLKIVA